MKISPVGGRLYPGGRTDIALIFCLRILLREGTLKDKACSRNTAGKGHRKMEQETKAC